MEASIEQLKQLQERRWGQVEILVIYIDGQRFAEHHILSAVEVDIEGHKHVPGIGSGATEGAVSFMAPHYRPVSKRGWQALGNRDGLV